MAHRGAAAYVGVVRPGPLYIASPLPRGGLAAFFSTHPPIPERVRRLRGFDAALTPRVA